MILKNTTRGHKHKIYKKQCRTYIRKYSFSQRVVNTWNSLPAKVIESNIVNGFNKPANFALERPRNQIQARYIQTRSDNGYEKSRRVAGETSPNL